MPETILLKPVVHEEVTYYPRRYDKVEGDYYDFESLTDVVMKLSEYRSPLVNNLLGFEKRVVNGEDEYIYYFDKETEELTRSTEDSTLVSSYLEQYLVLAEVAKEMQLLPNPEAVKISNGVLVLDGLHEYQGVRQKYPLVEFVVYLTRYKKIRKWIAAFENEEMTSMAFYRRLGKLSQYGVSRKWIATLYDYVIHRGATKKILASMHLVVPYTEVLVPTEGPIRISEEMLVKVSALREKQQGPGVEESFNDLDFLLTWIGGELTDKQLDLLLRILVRLGQQRSSTRTSTNRVGNIANSKDFKNLYYTDLLQEYTYLILRALRGILPN